MHPFLPGNLPLAEYLDVKRDHRQPQRKVIVTSNDTRLAPLLEPVRRNPYVSLTGSQARFDLSTMTTDGPEETGNISLMTVGSLAYSTPMFQLRSIDQMSFEEVCMNPTVIINAKSLGFIPQCAWISPNTSCITFGALVENFFRKRNSIHCKFPDKLYNALKLSDACPEFREHLGIQWVNDFIIRVHRTNFARLIGIKTVDGALFHQQGNFPSHGFVELSFEESDAISRANGFGPCDLRVVSFVKHSCGLFTRYSREVTVGQCKWTNQSNGSKKRTDFSEKD